MAVPPSAFVPPAISGLLPSPRSSVVARRRRAGGPIPATPTHPRAANAAATMVTSPPPSTVNGGVALTPAPDADATGWDAFQPPPGDDGCASCAGAGVMPCGACGRKGFTKAEGAAMWCTCADCFGTLLGAKGGGGGW